MPICHPGNISSQYVIPVNIEKMEHFFNVDPESTILNQICHPKIH